MLNKKRTIIFYYDGMLGADYHRPTDTPDKINYDLLAKRAQLVFYTAWEMANRNAMMTRDIVLQQQVPKSLCFLTLRFPGLRKDKKGIKNIFKKDWKNISSEFTEELQKQWKEKGFNYEQTKE